MSDLWYWKTHGKQYGPLSTGELEKLILRQKVTETDQFRVAETSDWLPAAEIKAMFNAAPEPSSSATAAEMASRVLLQRDRMQLEGDDEDTSGPSLTAQVLGKGVCASARGVSAVIGSFRDAVMFVLDKALGLVSRKVALAAIFVVLLAFFFKALRFDETRDEEIHTDLATAWEELKALHERGASEEELKQFAEETREWLDPTLAELQRSAIDEFRVNPFQFGARAHLDAAEAEAALLQAGRAFKELVEGGIAEQDRAGRIFVHEMSRSRDYLGGELQHGDDLSVRSRTEIRNAKRSAPRKARDTSNWTPLIAGLVVVDAGVLGALFFWWRRRS